MTLLARNIQPNQWTQSTKFLIYDELYGGPVIRWILTYRNVIEKLLKPSIRSYFGRPQIGVFFFNNHNSSKISVCNGPLWIEKVIQTRFFLSAIKVIIKKNMTKVKGYNKFGGEESNLRFNKAPKGCAPEKNKAPKGTKPIHPLGQAGST